MDSETNPARPLAKLDREAVLTNEEARKILDERGFYTCPNLQGKLFARHIRPYGGLICVTGLTRSELEAWIKGAA